VDENLPAPNASPLPEESSPCKDNTKEGGGDNGGEQSSSLNDDVEVDSSQTAYDEEFNQPKDVREEMYRMEKNKMRSPSLGKACLDRYRLASSHIFSLIVETLAENLGRKNFTLERASIDELFIDVTAFCYQSVIPTDNGDNAKEKETTAAAIKFRSDCDTNAIQSLKETVVCHEALVDPGEVNDETGEALRLGCHIALTARRAVFEKLGFTLSAGISTSKLVSKLAASYGKPDGQAVIFPGAMAKLMEETQIRKARMLGGKLGKKVQSLLPDSETTMGSISRLLPLDCLEKAIGEESGRWVFDACRGIDFEEVRPTLKVLPKSITAFKSFPNVSYPELEKWTTLLVRDVMKRVQADNARNNRIPKSISVGYTMVPGGAWIGQSFRLPFPTDRDFNSRVQKLVDNTRTVLTERGHTPLIRMGFSAIDFVVRPKIGIDSFFSKAKTQSSSTKRLFSGNNDGKKEAHTESGGIIDSFFITGKSQPATPKSITITSPQPIDHGNGALHGKNPPPKSNQKRTSSAIVSQQKAKGTGLHNWLSDDMAVAKMNSSDVLEHATNMTDEDIARQLQDSYNVETREQGNHNVSADKDKALACQLQSSYDREHAVLSHVERFSGKKSNNSKTKSHTKGNNNKRSKMDFFLKK